MQAEQTLRDGKADQALTELQQEIRRNPADPKLRVFLFQLLAIQGQWERALVQLNTAAELDPAALAMAQMYREALRCEALRAEVFAGKRSPLIFGQPPAWIGLLVEALRHTAQGQHEAAERLREQAFEAAEAVAGIGRWPAVRVAGRRGSAAGAHDRMHRGRPVSLGSRSRTSGES